MKELKAFFTDSWRWYHSILTIFFAMGCVLCTGVMPLSPAIFGIACGITELLACVVVPFLTIKIIDFFRGEPVLPRARTSQRISEKEIFNCIVENYGKERVRALRDMTHQPPHVCILGMGPTGLIAALRAYAAGATITIIEKRADYTRDSILRVSDKFLFSGEENVLPHNIINSLFLADKLDEDKRATFQSILLGKFSGVGFVEDTLDEVFSKDRGNIFHTITTMDFEKLLCDLLIKLQQHDPVNIKILRPCELIRIEAEHGKVWVQQGESEINVLASHIINASGSHGRLQSNMPLVQAMFPAHASGQDNIPIYQPAPYLAATLETKDNGLAGRVLIGTETRNTLPAGFKHGAILLSRCTNDPDLKLKIQRRIADFESTSRQRKRIIKTNTLLEQAVVAGYHERSTYYNDGPSGAGRNPMQEDLALDLSCAELGIKSNIGRMQREFSWHHDNRLPLIRLFSTRNTIYVGMEIPANLYAHVSDVTKSEEERDQLLLTWIHLCLEQFFPQRLIDQLVVRNKSVFNLQINLSKNIMHLYEDSGVQVFNLGDALVTPHFLTGSGLESAAISVDRWVRYMKGEFSQEEYVHVIREDVQARALNKLQGLRKLNMFQPREDEDSCDLDEQSILTQGATLVSRQAA
jgi:2-polyprenyl-6-methoxyphenol hydroxylase-like FAD-dependent oxidoreductase